MPHINRLTLTQETSQTSFPSTKEWLKPSLWAGVPSCSCRKAPLGVPGVPAWFGFPSLHDQHLPRRSPDCITGSSLMPNSDVMYPGNILTTQTRMVSASFIRFSGCPLPAVKCSLMPDIMTLTAFSIFPSFFFVTLCTSCHNSFTGTSSSYDFMTIYNLFSWWRIVTSIVSIVEEYYHYINKVRATSNPFQVAKMVCTCILT